MHKQSQNNPTEIKYSRFTWETKEITNYLSVKNETNFTLYNGLQFHPSH